MISVSSSPKNVASLVNSFYIRNANLEPDQHIDSLHPPSVFAMRKVRSLNDVHLQKLEKLGLKEKISQPILMKKKWGAAVGISALLSSQNAGFKADGPDDMANLAKESVEGVAQPLVHLGVLGLFYPFVAMGAQGLQQDLDDLREERGDLQESIEDVSQRLVGLHKTLQDQGVQLQGLDAPRQEKQNSAAFSLQQFKRQFSEFSKSLPSLLKSNPDQVELLIEYQKEAIKLGFLAQDLKLNQRDDSESWTAAKGMRGMQRAMQLFIAEAASSLMTFITTGKAASTFASVATGVGVLGTGLMAGAQFLMMTSGLFKMRTGMLDFKDMRSQRNDEQERLKHISTITNSPDASELDKALSGKIKHDTRKAGWDFMRQALPGASLATGQALMLSWSIASLAFMATGVGAPVGMAMMLGLLIPGVGLTLAASLPKVGLESVLNAATDERFGVHDSDDGFDKIQYAQSLPRQPGGVAQHVNALSDLLQSIEDSDTDTFLQELRNSSASSESDFDILYRLLGRADQLEDFSCELMRKKTNRKESQDNVESLFSFDRVIETADVEPIFTLKNALNPLHLRHSKLFHKGAKREISKTFMHFEPTRVTNIKSKALQKNVIESAVTVLKDFSIKQLRAELEVSRNMLQFSEGYSNESKSIEVIQPSRTETVALS